MIRSNSRACYMPPELRSRQVERDTDPHPAAVPSAIECHYCGYEPPPGRKGRICPKCGGSSWEPVAPEETLAPDILNDDASPGEMDWLPRRFDDPEDEEVENDSTFNADEEGFDDQPIVAANTSGARVHFHVGCRAQQVYVVTWVDDERVRVIPMHRSGRRAWDVTVQLEAGPREYLYLVDDGHDLIEQRPTSRR